MWQFLEPLTKSAAFQMVSDEKYCRDLSFSVSALWHRRRSVFCAFPLPTMIHIQPFFFKEKENIQLTNQSHGHYGEVTKRCRSFFFVRPVTWAPPAITGLKIEPRTGLRRTFCQYMGLLAPAMMTAHEAAWNLPGLPSYHPAPRLTI